MFNASAMVPPAVPLAAINRVLRTHRMPPSRFGRDAVNDPRLVFDLRAGSSISMRRFARVLAFIASMEARHD